MKILAILTSIIFIAAGLSKVVGLKIHQQHFKHWNLPRWFMYLTGVLELATGTLLLFENFQYVGAILGVFVMLGAISTCWIASDYQQSILPSALLIALGILIWNIAPATILTWSIFGLVGISLLVAAILWLYPNTPMNKDGETEYLEDDTLVTHHFKEVLGVNYHYVTAGNSENHAVVIIPGAPESWYCFHHQVIALSKKYYVIALDMKPYGQTGNDLDGNHSFPNIANEIKSLMDELGIEKFHLMGHDRGTVATDHLLSKDGMTERVTSYIRMQQSFNEPHGDPVPPHHLMSSYFGTMAYKIRFAMYLTYVKSAYTKLPIDKKVVQRISKEFKFKGIPQGMPLTFKTTSFPKELKDRQDKLFQFMTMPILILQGRFDPGQHPEEYENSHQFAADLRVHFVEAGHFFHLEAPEETNKVMLDFFAEQNLKNKEDSDIKTQEPA